ncbi:MAG: hypothetical protein KAU58_06460, partial [Candidatus Omnitrophica bacterium]|nr:hypothetical protein [Candidatus Omnitrophota bacterium]
RLFGIVILVMGTIFLVKKDALKQYLSYWKQEKRIRIGGIIAIPFGIIFLLAASQCRLTWLIAVLGIWSIIKGVLLLTLGQEKINTYLDWWLNRPTSRTRLLSLIAIAFGILIIYAA